jgi:hypothetical protein
VDVIIPPTMGAAIGFITSDPIPLAQRIGIRLADRQNRNTRRNLLPNRYQNMASGFGAEPWGVGPFTFAEFTGKNRASEDCQRGLTLVSTRLADVLRC